MPFPTVIIGAGLTGLSCAYHLRGDYLLIEKENEPGGVVRTHTRHTTYGDFYCDGTGHWLHLRNPYMQQLVPALLPGGLVEYERKAVIYSKGVFTPYPFQANTYGLPAEVVLDCLLGLLRAKHPGDFKMEAPQGKPQNFREWIVRNFGEGICKHFMVPYNEKLLGVKLEDLAPEYAERFIPQPSVEDVIKGALGFSRESLGYNAKFVYPKEGGIGALPRAFEKALKVKPRYETCAGRVDLKAKTVTLPDGETVRYDHLVNTMPLVRFLDIVEEIPREVLDAAAKLRATTVHYFDIGVRGAASPASGHHWIYVPEPDFIFYRTGSYSAVHRDAAPAGCRSYYVEMSGGVTALLDDVESLKTRVLADLRRLGVITEQDEIVFMELCKIPHAYVIFDKHYEKARDTVLKFLEDHNVQTCGRWGGWNYGGMEDAMLEGKAAAERINGEKAQAC